MFVLLRQTEQLLVGYAVAQAPTFFSLWIGNNDVLGYATTGGDGSINYSFCRSGAGFDTHMMLW
jgi:hypothetical protein